VITLQKLFYTGVANNDKIGGKMFIFICQGGIKSDKKRTITRVTYVLDST